MDRRNFLKFIGVVVVVPGCSLEKTWKMIPARWQIEWVDKDLDYKMFMSPNKQYILNVFQDKYAFVWKLEDGEWKCGKAYSLEEIELMEIPYE